MSLDPDSRILEYKKITNKEKLKINTAISSADGQRSWQVVRARDRSATADLVRRTSYTKLCTGGLLPFPPLLNGS